MRSGRARNLLLEHPHRVGKRSHAIPAQFHVVVEPTADDVRVAVDQAGNDAATLEVNASRAGTGQAHDVLLGPHCNETVAADGDRLCLRVLPVEGRYPAVEENKISGAILGRCSTKAGGKCAEPGQHTTAIWTKNHDWVLLL